MESKNHTPAPWTTELSPNSKKVAIFGANDRLVAMADYSTARQDLGGEMPTEANARLIAAAPDLFRQLDNTISMLESIWNKEDVSPALLRVTIDEARAAIAKARGQS